MGPVFEPADGIRHFQIATAPVIGLRAVRTAMSMIGEAGIGAIAAKAARGTELRLRSSTPGWHRWGSPAHSQGAPSAWRSHHDRPSDAKQIAAAMRVLTRTIPDYRVPDSIRLAISPCPPVTRKWDGFDRLRDLVASERVPRGGVRQSRAVTIDPPVFSVTI